jgi:hypothetical protein
MSEGEGLQLSPEVVHALILALQIIQVLATIIKVVLDTQKKAE